MVWAWIIAYFVAGEGFVSKEASEPVYNQPGYVRSKKGRWAVRLLWPLVSIRIWMSYRRNSPALRQKYFGGQFLPTWFLFVAIGSIGTLIANWLSG